MTLRELLAEGEHVLQTAGIEDWKMDAWYLLEETLEVTRTRYLVDSGKAVSAAFAGERIYRGRRGTAGDGVQAWSAFFCSAKYCFLRKILPDQ